MVSMKNTIAIINAGDISPAVQIAKDLPSYTVYLFDPVLVDMATASGLQNIKLIAWDNCPLYDELDADARATAFALEAELDMAVRDIVPDVSIAAWQHLNLYYLFMMLKWYSGLWNGLGNKLVGTQAHIFICDNPATYYFNSFIPSVLLLWYLKSHGIEFSGYTYGATDDVSLSIPDLSGVNEDGHIEQMLTHLPTCWYDVNYFHQEIKASGKQIINIEAKHFNIPVPAHKTLSLVNANDVFPGLPEPLRDTIDAFLQRVVETLDRYLAPYIVVGSYRERQVQHLGTLYRCQLLTYYQLNQHFEHSKPSKILLSDHDTGFHGPIVSFARKHFLPILLLPHSKISTDVEFEYRNITALTHPIQGREISDAGGKSVFNARLLYPETFSGSSLVGKGIKTVSFLLTAYSLNGVCFSRWASYIEGIRRIVAWSEENGIELKIRCKPSYSLFHLLAAEIGCDKTILYKNMAESMEQHVASCDLCLMYDSPTSADLYFLKNSVPILNLVDRPLTPNELAMCNPLVVPRESVGAGLRRLDGFKSDPVCFAAFRNAQFRNYIQLFQGARPLRSYL